MEESYSYFGENKGTNFPGSPHRMGFVACSHVMENWRQDPCISHMRRFPNCFLCINLDGARLHSWFVRFFIHVIHTIPIPPPPDKYSTLGCVFPRILSPGFFTNTPILRSQNSNIYIKWTTYKDKKPFASRLCSACPFSVKRAHHRNALQLTFQLLRTTNRLNQKPFLPETSKMLFEFISTTCQRRFQNPVKHLRWSVLRFTFSC